MFVTFEGVDWSGKSTQDGLLAAWLREQGRAVLGTREPGGTPIAEAVRDVVLHGHDMTPWAEAALYAAARADHVEHAIRPALERGEDAVLQLNLTVTRGLLPDRTILVLLDADEAQRRGAGRPDRIEREGAG